MNKKEAAEIKRNRAEMAEHAPADKARRQMQHKPYAAMLIRAQGEQIEKSGDDPVPEDLLEDRHLDPAEYLAQKYSIGSDADGQDHTE